MISIRPRRNRKSSTIRSIVAEHSLSASDFVYPLFLSDDQTGQKALSSLPGQHIWSSEAVLGEIEECLNLGLSSFILFPKVSDQYKDKIGSYGYSQDNFYLNVARRIKERFPEVCLISDVAMDPYSSDGHDGLVIEGKINNDKTLPILERMSVAQAQAGFDILGPSDMMDGRVGAIRHALDTHGYSDTSIMSYTAKYASAFYGPFRDALDSAPVIDKNIPTDKKTYQMNPANSRTALIEAELDTLEGADFLMVKPATLYLDIISLLRQNFTLPIAAYHVSGEYAMIHAAAQLGWLDLKDAASEALLSIKRAGADVILTYFAKDYLLWSQSLK